MTMLAYKFKSNADFSHLLDILVNRRLFLPVYTALNDPMEGVYQFSTSPEDEDNFSAFEGLMNRARIGSLSKDYRRGLLWAHYANGYRGAAIEIEILDNCAEIHDVKYVTKIPNIGNNWSMGLAKVEWIFKRKFTDWKYEREVRIIRAANEDGYFTGFQIKKVIIGHRMPLHQLDIIKWICATQRIAVQGIENAEDGKSVYAVDLQHLTGYCVSN